MSLKHVLSNEIYDFPLFVNTTTCVVQVNIVLFAQVEGFYLKIRVKQL